MSDDTRDAGGRLPMPFIVGTGRCGTTLLRVMLDAHPLLSVPPETHFLREVIVASTNSDDPRAHVTRAMTESRNWNHFHVDPDALRAQVSEIEPFDPGEAIRAFFRLYAERFGKPRWGDKTPGYLTAMRGIQAILPEAHFIHLVRDGRDVALSVLPQMDRSGERHSVEDGARWWVQRLQQGRRQAAEVHHYLEIRYEALVSDPEPVLRRICQFIALPWDAAMLDYHAGARERLSADGQRPGGLQRLSKPPDLEKVGRWRLEMSADDLARVEAIAGPMLREYGYD